MEVGSPIPLPFRRSIHKEISSNWWVDWAGIDCPLIKVPFDNRSMNKVTRIDIHFSDIQKFVSSSPVFEKPMYSYCHYLEHMSQKSLTQQNSTGI